MTSTDVLQKITFHSGIIEGRIFDVFARTKCQIEIKSEEISRPVAVSEDSYTNSFVGMWAKKSKTIQNRDPRDNAYLNFCIMWEANIWSYFLCRYSWSDQIKSNFLPGQFCLVHVWKIVVDDGFRIESAVLSHVEGRCRHSFLLNGRVGAA